MDTLMMAVLGVVVSIEGVLVALILRFETRIEGRMGRLEGRMDRLEGRIDRVLEVLMNHDRRIGDLERG